MELDRQALVPDPDLCHLLGKHLPLRPKAVELWKESQGDLWAQANLLEALRQNADSPEADAGLLLLTESLAFLRSKV